MNVMAGAKYIITVLLLLGGAFRVQQGPDRTALVQEAQVQQETQAQTAEEQVIEEPETEEQVIEEPETEEEVMEASETEEEETEEQETEEQAAEEPEAAEETAFSLEFQTSSGETLLTQENIASAVAAEQSNSIGQTEYIVSLVFDEAGAELFAQATAEHVGEMIQIVVNGEVVSAPVVREAITDGKCVISGSFTMESAQELADLINGKVPESDPLELLISRAEEVSLEFVTAYGTDEAETILTQDNIASAEAVKQWDLLANTEYAVSLVFDEAGSEAFAQAAGEHIGEQLSIVLNGEVISTPVVRKAITDGKYVISGDFTMKSAQDLAEKLNSMAQEAAGDYSVTADDEEISSDVARLYLRYRQSDFEAGIGAFYMMYLGGTIEDVWKADLTYSGTSYWKIFKEQVRDELYKMVLCRRYAEELGVTLSEDEQAYLRDRADEFMLDCDSEYAVLTADALYEMLECLMLQKKVESVLDDDVDTEVSEEESAQRTVSFIYFENSEEDGITDAQARAEAFLAKAEESEEDMNNLFTEEEYEDDYCFSSSWTFGDNDDYPDAVFIEDTADCPDGTLIDHIIEYSERYYVLYVRDAYDEEASEEKAAEIVEARVEELLQNQYAEWNGQTEVHLDFTSWEPLKPGKAFTEEMTELLSECIDDVTSYASE